MLVKVRPYNNKYLFYRDAVTEFCYILMHILFLALVKNEDNKNNGKEVIGNITVVILMIILIV